MSFKNGKWVLIDCVIVLQNVPFSDYSAKSKRIIFTMLKATHKFFKCKYMYLIVYFCTFGLNIDNIGEFFIFVGNEICEGMIMQCI